MKFFRCLSGYAVAAAAVTTAFTTLPASGQSVKEFYRGKQITMVVGYGAGGGFDLFARLVARHLGNYLPGNPNVVVQNMPGASSVKAANYLYNAAQKDGAVLGALGSTLAVNQLLGRPGKYDAGKFYWVGRLAAGDTVAVAWHTTGVKTVADLKNKQIAWAGGSRTGPNVMLAAALKNVLGAKLKIVQGYRGSAKMIGAMEKREADATVTGWAALRDRRGHLLRDNKVNLLFYMGYERASDLPALPTLIETGPTEEAKSIFRLVTSWEIIGRNYNAPPGIPADRGTALRVAFDRMVKDKAFLDDMNKRNILISPMGGAELQKVVEDVMKTDAATAAKFKKATNSLICQTL